MNDTIDHDFTPTPPAFPARPGKPRILVVDDETEIRDLLRMALGDSNQYEVETAEDGRQGLQMLRSRRFDLVITDLMMPEMDGSRLLDITHHEFPDIPIVVVTGYAKMETVIDVLRLGAANFITKPFRLKEIYEVIKKAIKRKRDREIPQMILPCLVREELTFSIPPTFETKAGVVHYLTEKLVGLGICDDSGGYFISVSLDEALTNAIFYGCLEVSSDLRETEPGTEVFNKLVTERMEEPHYRNRAIKVEMELTPERVLYRITDPGKGFDAPDLKNAEPEPTGLSQLHGRGLLLISCFMDEVSFNKKGNQITMTKYRQTGES
jgi:CheY-like chemotaxis protein